MANDEILDRLDRHLERGNELMGETREALERNREAFERNTEAFADWRLFMRELLVRFDRVIERRDREHGAFLESLAERLRAETRATREAAEAAREESRAVVAGLLKVIDRRDRFEPGDGPATA